MTTTSTVGGRRRRRRGALGAGAGAAALLVAFASVAYACTILIGTFTVCEPPTATGAFGGGTPSTQCGQRGLTSTQVGAPSFATSGSDISIKAVDFALPPPIGTTVYSLTFALLGPNCHLFNISGGVTSLLGTWDHDASSTTAEVPRTLEGPDFVVGIGASSTDPMSGQGLSAGAYDTITTPSVSAGAYSVCAQDTPERVDGNAVNAVVV